MRYHSQVARVHAGADVAQVVNFHAYGDRSNSQLIGESVRSVPLPSSDRETAVTLLVLRSCPRPALVRLALIDSRPEPFSHCEPVSRHAAPASLVLVQVLASSHAFTSERRSALMRWP